MPRGQVILIFFFTWTHSKFESCIQGCSPNTKQQELWVFANSKNLTSPQGAFYNWGKQSESENCFALFRQNGFFVEYPFFGDGLLTRVSIHLLYHLVAFRIFYIPIMIKICIVSNQIKNLVYCDSWSTVCGAGNLTCRNT